MWEDLSDVRAVSMEVRICDCSAVVVWYCFGPAIAASFCASASIVAAAVDDGAATVAAAVGGETAAAAAASGEIMVEVLGMSAFVGVTVGKLPIVR